MGPTTCVLGAVSNNERCYWVVKTLSYHFKDHCMHLHVLYPWVDSISAIFSMVPQNSVKNCSSIAPIWACLWYMLQYMHRQASHSIYHSNSSDFIWRPNTCLHVNILIDAVYCISQYSAQYCRCILTREMRREGDTRTQRLRESICFCNLRRRILYRRVIFGGGKPQCLFRPSVKLRRAKRVQKTQIPENINK